MSALHYFISENIEIFFESDQKSTERLTLELETPQPILPFLYTVKNLSKEYTLFIFISGWKDQRAWEQAEEIWISIGRQDKIIGK